jgi:hypothetical protein
MKGGVSWRGGSWELVKPTVTIQLKMEEVCILCNVIEILWQNKVTKIERCAFWPFQAPNGIAIIM